MFKIHRVNDLPTTGLVDGDIYYVPNKDNLNAMDVYVINKNEIPKKVSTTNGTEIVFKDSIGVNDEIDNIYNEHKWVNTNEKELQCCYRSYMDHFYHCLLYRQHRQR